MAVGVQLHWLHGWLSGRLGAGRPCSEGFGGREDLKTWAEAGARSSIYRADLAEKFKGTRELDHHAPHLLQRKIWLRPCRFHSRIGFMGSLEMAYEDWCISQIAAKAGETELANAYAERELLQTLSRPGNQDDAPDYGRRFLPDTLQPALFRPSEERLYRRNAFQWSFFVPHDMDNFIAAIGGKQELETRLDTLFTTSSQIDGRKLRAILPA